VGRGPYKSGGAPHKTMGPPGPGPGLLCGGFLAGSRQVRPHKIFSERFSESPIPPAAPLQAFLFSIPLSGGGPHPQKTPENFF